MSEHPVNQTSRGKIEHWWIEYRWAYRLIRNLRSADYYKIVIKSRGRKSVEELTKQEVDKR